MKSNEEYLGELLNSMNEEEETAGDNTVSLMDQAMIDALLAAENETEDEPVEYEDTVLEQTMIDTASLAADVERGTEEESGSMLAQLMAEMQEEAVEDAGENTGENSLLTLTEEENLMTEEGIEALLSAAKSGAEKVEEEVSYEMPNASEIAEIEALLGMSDSGEVVDENMALLQMLEEADSFSEEPIETEEVKEVDLEELDSLLSLNKSEKSGESGSVANIENEAADVDKKEKKPGKMKGFFGKIMSALVEEIPDDEISDTESINLSDENKDILNQLDQEDKKKIKAKEKKEKKEKKLQAKKEKKEAKEKKAQEKKAKEKKVKPVKEKKEKPVAIPEIPEKKLPKKEVMVTFAFAFSVLVAILVIEFLVPPILSVSRARSAFDKGEYLEAYKEYYGQKLSEEDEKRFQAATVILRMESNLDGYESYLRIGDKVQALHSLLEAVHVRDDVFAQAQEFDVLSKVSSVYNEILEVLNAEYHLNEEAAMELVQEKSDVTYTRKLQSLTEGKAYEEDDSKEMSQENLLPEEEELFLDAD